MRLAVLCLEYPTVSATFITDQVAALEQRGHTVTVIADRAEATLPVVGRTDVRYTNRPKPRHRQVVEGVRVAWRLLRGGHLRVLAAACGVRRYGTVALQLRLLFTAGALVDDEARYDALICHFGPSGIVGAFLRDVGLHEGSLHVVFHGYDLTSEVRRRSTVRAYRHVVAVADDLLPVSERLAGRLQELGADPAKVTVLRTGVDPNRFRPVSQPRPDGRIIALSVARLTEKKGIDVALRAVSMAATEVDLEYLVVGDGELRAELEALAAELGLGSVRFLGPRSHADVRALLARADVLLAPSVTAASGDEEGVPVAIMEAMACEVPVVSTRHAGIPELIEHGRNGILVAERDASALAAAVVELAKDAELRRRLGAAGRTRILDSFDAGVHVDRLVELIERRRA